MLSEPRASELLSALSGLIRTSRSITTRAHGASITGTQISLLQALSPGPARLGDLAAQLMVAASVASRVVSGLEVEGLIERNVDPADARACLVGLTDLGRQRLLERQEFSLHLVREVLEDWSDEDAEQTTRALRRLEARVPDFNSRMLDQPEMSRRSLRELTTDAKTLSQHPEREIESTA